MSSPEHVECGHFEESNSKIHNGMLLLAHAYHMEVFRIKTSLTNVDQYASAHVIQRHNGYFWPIEMFLIFVLHFSLFLFPFSFFVSNFLFLIFVSHFSFTFFVFPFLFLIFCFLFFVFIFILFFWVWHSSAKLISRAVYWWHQI